MNKDSFDELFEYLKAREWDSVPANLEETKKLYFEKLGHMDSMILMDAFDILIEDSFQNTFPDIQRIWDVLGSMEENKRHFGRISKHHVCKEKKVLLAQCIRESRECIGKFGNDKKRLKEIGIKYMLLARKVKANIRCQLNCC